MARYLAFDGGGTKIKAVVFDENYNILSYEQSGGVNLNFYKYEDVERHIDNSIGKSAESGITAAYGILVGSNRRICERIQNYMPDAEISYLGEDMINLLSGLFKQYGVCVLSGTGATFYWRGESGHGALGGLGAYIGDEGSGYYIGEHGIRAAMRYMNGWGEKTLLRDLFFEMTGGKNPFEYFYGASFSHIPMHMKISGFTRQVGKACEAGDEISIRIVTEAGEYLALQTIALFRKYDIPHDVDILLCGGAWKTDYRMKQRFIELFQPRYPETNIVTPILEPVAGGAVWHAVLTDSLDDVSKSKIINNFRGL